MSTLVVVSNSKIDQKLTHDSVFSDWDVHQVRAVLVALVLVGERSLLVLVALDAILELSATVGAGRALLAEFA